MPGFDGTGPRGMGPLTGGGRGYCATVLPDPATGAPVYGYAGLAGRPFVRSTPITPLPTYGRALVGRPRWGMRLGGGRGLGLGRGRGGRAGRGRGWR